MRNVCLVAGFFALGSIQVVVGAENQVADFNQSFRMFAAKVWPDAKLKEAGDSSCPTVNIKSRPVADTVVVQEQGAERKLTESRESSNIFLWRPPGHREGVPKINVAVDVDTVQIALSQEMIEITASRHGATVDRLMLSFAKGDFACHSGVIKFQASKFGGAGESGRSDFTTYLEIGVTEDSQVIYRQLLLRESSNLGIRGQQMRFERFVKFRPN